jgi:hypothetical protein
MLNCKVFACHPQCIFIDSFSAGTQLRKGSYFIEILFYLVNFTFLGFTI